MKILKNLFTKKICKNDYDKIVIASIEQLIKKEEPEEKTDEKYIKKQKEYVFPALNLLNDDSSKKLIPFIKEIRENEELSIPIGICNNDILIEHVGSMPNLLIGGTVMSGKSTYINLILVSLLFTRTPHNLKLIIFDSKGVEYSVFNDIPHLLVPIVSEEKKFLIVLKKIKIEIESRYKLLKDSNKKNIKQYNNMLNDNLMKIPDLIIIIDDYIKLSLIDEINDYVEYISKNGWNVNVYLIVVANHPSAKIISTISKSNFPTRLSFKVTSKKDSMIVLEKYGAEKLTEIGSALYSSRYSNILKNVKIPIISEIDIKNIVNHITLQQLANHDEIITIDNEEMSAMSNVETTIEEPLYNEIVEFVVIQGKASASLLQRRFRLGYNRASRCIDLLEERDLLMVLNRGRY